MLHDWVLIRPTSSSGGSQTPSGLYLPDDKKNPILRGHVVDSGPGRWLESAIREAPDLHPGDVVLFTKNVATDVIVGGKSLVMVRYADLRAVE